MPVGSGVDVVVGSGEFVFIFHDIFIYFIPNLNNAYTIKIALTLYMIFVR